jgi:hypothetical protein
MAETLTAGQPGTPGDAPASDAAGVAETRSEGEAPLAPPALPGLRPGEGDHRGKFRIAFAGLALILVSAIVGVVILLARPGGSSSAAGWSEWHPRGGSDVEQAQQIADHVAVEYRLPEGDQLVTVQAEAPEVQSIPIDFIAIRSTPDGAVYPDNAIPIFRDANSKGIQYLLCGLGEACSIPIGQPSVERQRLLRREALELALYTFRYVSGRDYVVVYMPPKAGDRPTYALFFERSDFKRELDVPLRQTLPDPLALTPESLTPFETTVIDRLTNPHFFAYSYSQLQNQQVVLVLADPTGVTPQPLQPSTQSDRGSTGTTSTETATSPQ